MSYGDPDRQEGWERADFPIVCETCLGDNPYVRMQKIGFDKECKVCTRPFTVFRWKAGSDGRFKKTEICQTCAKVKNVCQTCILDLEFSLPVQVRDAALGSAAIEQAPQSDANRGYHALIADQRVAQGLLPYQNAQYTNVVHQLARTEPYYERNKARICSFFVKGTCNRGDLCPYRHEKPKQGDLADQNIRDRYHGENDPVAKKLMSKLKDRKSVEPGGDVKTVWLGGLPPDTKEEQIRGLFYAYGEISSVNVVAAQNIAFVEYTTHEAAKQAISKSLSNPPDIGGYPIKVDWAKPQRSNASPSSDLSVFPPPVGHGAVGSWSAYYPSMNPQMNGAYASIPPQGLGYYLPQSGQGSDVPAPKKRKTKSEPQAERPPATLESAPKRQKVTDSPV